MDEKTHGFGPIESEKTLAGGWTGKMGPKCLRDVAKIRGAAEDEAFSFFMHMVSI